MSGVLVLWSLVSLGHSAITNEFSGSKFQYFDQADRVDTISQFCSVLKKTYASWELKKNTIGLNSQAHCDQAIELEKKILEPQAADALAKTQAEAIANHAFFDRFQKFVATFQDGHMSLGLTSPRTRIFLPIEFRSSGGKLIVSGLTQVVLRQIGDLQKNPDFEKIALGDELIAIDDHSPEVEISKLIPYVSAGSPLAARLDAISKLTYRSFLYPHTPKVKVTLKSATDHKLKDFEFEWNYSRVSRKDDLVFFKANGFPEYKVGRFSYETRYKPMVAAPTLLSSVEEYRNVDSLALSMRTGIYTDAAGNQLGVMQLLDFHTERVMVAPAYVPLPYVDAVRSVVQNFKRKQLPLIIDVRENGGGNGGYPSQILSLITPKGKTFAASTIAFRTSTFIRSLFDNAPALLANAPIQYLPGHNNGDILSVIEDAVAGQNRYSDSLGSESYKADTQVDGFESKIVLLQSPNCVSACEIFAAGFKAAGRGVVMGGPTHGTGSGFIGDGRLSVEWSDSLQIFATVIPNILFGRPGPQVGVARFPGTALELNTENRPGKPDVKYVESEQDVLDSDSGWFAKAAEVLLKKP